MSDSQFQQRIEDTLLQIEEAIDDVELDVDFENVGGVLTLTFDNGVQLILNGQSAASQLWLAAPDGGHHFDWKAESWVRDRDGKTLNAVLGELFTQNGVEPITL